MQFAILGQTLEFSIEYAPTTATLADLADGVYWLCDQTTQIVTRTINKTGGTIACRKGCAFCCRHLIPVSVAEASSLARRLLENPHTNASCIERFRAAAAHVNLEFDRFRRRVNIDGMAFAELSRRLNAWYAQVAIDCPMLADRSCCIYDCRPMICRQWGVVGSPEQCTNGAAAPTHKIPQPVGYSDILRQVGVRLGLTGNETVLLPFALDWCQTNRPKCDTPIPAAELVTQFLNALARKTRGAVNIL